MFYKQYGDPNLNVPGIEKDRPVIPYTFGDPGSLQINKKLKEPDVPSEAPPLQLTLEEETLLTTVINDTCAFLAGDDLARQRLVDRISAIKDDELMAGIPLGRHVRFDVGMWPSAEEPEQVLARLLPECPDAPIGELPPLHLSGVPVNSLIWADWGQLEGVVTAPPTAAGPGRAGPSRAPAPSDVGGQLVALEEESRQLLALAGRLPEGPHLLSVLERMFTLNKEIEKLVSGGVFGEAAVISQLINCCLCCPPPCRRAAPRWSRRPRHPLRLRRPHAAPRHPKPWWGCSPRWAGSTSPPLARCGPPRRAPGGSPRRMCSRSSSSRCPACTRAPTRGR